MAATMNASYSQASPKYFALTTSRAKPSNMLASVASMTAMVDAVTCADGLFRKL
jgi:hypothetical protein